MFLLLIFIEVLFVNKGYDVWYLFLNCLEKNIYKWESEIEKER